jgi:hypothetical protein
VGEIHARATRQDVSVIKTVRSGVKTSRSSGSNHLRGAQFKHYACSSRSLQRKHCTIRGSDTPIGRKSECGIDSATVGWRTTWTPANARLSETHRSAHAIKILNDYGPRQTA